MNITKWIMICLLAVALAPVGCSKKETSSVPPAVDIDVPKLRDAFANASPELKAQATSAIRMIASHREADAVPLLEQLANAPGLTDDQKKALAEVTGQAKQMANRAAAMPTK